MQPDPLGEKIAKHLPGSTATYLAERRRHLKASAAVDTELASTIWQRSEERKSRETAARDTLEHVTAEQKRGFATERDVAEAKLTLKRERELSAKWSGEADEIQNRAAASQAVVDATDRYLRGLKWPTERKALVYFEHDKSRPDPLEGIAPEVEIMRPKLSEGDLHAIVDKQRAEVARLKREADDVDHTPDRIESVKRRARQQLEELAARGAPVVSGAGEAGVRLSIQPPLMDIGAEPGHSSGGLIPKAHDALALLAWAIPDKVMEAVEASIDEAYLGVDVQLDPHERQRRRREIKAAILAAERIECEARWQLIEAGDETIRFRPDCDPRAILGIA